MMKRCIDCEKGQTMSNLQYRKHNLVCKNKISLVLFHYDDRISPDVHQTVFASACPKTSTLKARKGTGVN